MQHEWIDRDIAVNWHPYSQMKTSKHIPIVRGKDAYLYDMAGNRYLDMVSSWWVTLHGHSNSYIAEKVYEQLTTLEQVIFAGFTHEPAIKLSERLLNLLPSNQKKVFYSDNGSTAVEVALKMCIQYAFNQGLKKNKIIAFKNGYHGDTFGAMSVSERGTWTAPFAEMLFDVIFIDVPTSENLAETKKIIARHSEEIACFIYEPLVQGAGGMLMHEAAPLSELMKFCRSEGILMIQDEVFVGFGRTGTLFAADQLTEQPDVMCFSKGLTGGTMPMGISTCTEELYQAFYSDEKRMALFHGHSFTASPIACAASLASLDLLLQESTLKKIREIEEFHANFALELGKTKNARNIRQTGTILAFDWESSSETSYFNKLQEKLFEEFMDRGILLRPMGNVLYILPPYCIQEEDLRYTYQQILELLNSNNI
ncbi:adenosylmethionine--8-amino-7-oxononanoate transaminase [Sphingobacterium cellulitidis]|uniref:adenosylmethionine--8-amino-7-oxononanoate transaminase n=1 Tax=Sphingobacterium cellulitidis TaxID=1768011 RepID=UPI000B944657|nr:adenosylmethionine--8-amino-7-oxononanoate transaminase [Sphingobacterium cellulitidis]OYD44208.1 adenosylmethionine--8-amino-7-oxononanoate transaminase [Sphingobacterium cellulitidis]